jgi:hypothetical protein
VSVRNLLVAALLAAAPLGALAVEARKYAALSLLGDRLLIVTHEMATGSRRDTNQRQFVELQDASLDRAATGAIADALRAARATMDAVDVSALSIRDAQLFDLGQDALDDGDAGDALIAALRAKLGRVDATHLVLATKYRHASMLRLAAGHVGSGRLEGLGFYIDTTFKTRRSDTGERGTGFLAPFAYFRLSLVDLATWKVVREERVLGSSVQSAARAGLTPSPARAEGEPMRSAARSGPASSPARRP